MFLSQKNFKKWQKILSSPLPLKKMPWLRNFFGGGSLSGLKNKDSIGNARIKKDGKFSCFNKIGRIYWFWFLISLIPSPYDLSNFKHVIHHLRIMGQSMFGTSNFGTAVTLARSCGLRHLMLTSNHFNSATIRLAKF